MTNTIQKRAGFNLIEVIVVIAITSLIGAATLLFSIKLQNIGDTTSAKQELIQNLRLAQSKAMAGENDSSFGVYIQNNQYTLYRGSNYGLRVAPEDQILTLPKELSVSTSSDIAFTKKTGIPSAPITLTITDDINGKTETITINELGQMY